MKGLERHFGRRLARICYRAPSRDGYSVVEGVHFASLVWSDTRYIPTTNRNRLRFHRSQPRVVVEVPRVVQYLSEVCPHNARGLFEARPSTRLRSSAGNFLKKRSSASPVDFLPLRADRTVYLLGVTLAWLAEAIIHSARTIELGIINLAQRIFPKLPGPMKFRASLCTELLQWISKPPSHTNQARDRENDMHSRSAHNSHMHGTKISS